MPELLQWKMDYEQYRGLECQAPCSMYSVLLKEGLIEDPFYGLNETKYTSLSEKDCTFRCEFTPEEEVLAKEYIRLEFYGIDTICDIYCNDVLLDSVKDMHRFYAYDVKKLLHRGNNEIRLEFKAPITYITDMNRKHFLWTAPDTVEGAPHLRKAMSMFGWDWGPKLPDMGIFRKVVLNAYETDAIEDVFVMQNHRAGEVELEFSVTTRHGSDADIYVEFDTEKICLKNGRGKMTVKNPRLWWVRGYGEQHLYEMKTELSKDGRVIDTDIRRIGLRTLTVSTARDELGSEFCFVNNGIKIFAMGADYVPEDNLLSRVTKEKTKKLLDACADANHNCIRVWGGGYYPSDDFYDICDELGIIVWQDFMSACHAVWLTEETKEDYTQEAVYNIKRFRLHPSLGLFCGNNELEWNILRNHEFFGSKLVMSDYLELFERILPALCDKLAPQTFYWPSSPSSGGGFQDPENALNGDSHYWDVWFGGVPFSDYQKQKIRFCSEYGFQSFPSMKTIRSFAGEKDLNAFSRVIELHQKSAVGNKQILAFLSDYYLLPYSFEDLVYASQLLQADAIRYGVEHFRSIRGICMGSLYWQLNDCWPCASWSSVDYFGRYKALHYAAKKFYAPVAIGLKFEKDELLVNLSNETRTAFKGSLKVRLCDNDFKTIREIDADAQAEALSAEDIFCKKIPAQDAYSNYIVAELYDDVGRFVMKQTAMYVRPKYYEWQKPDVKVRFEKVDDTQVKAYVTSDVFAKNVALEYEAFDCVMSDNFFDLTGLEPYVVTLQTDRSVKELQEQLRIKTVYDIGACS